MTPNYISPDKLMVEGYVESTACAQLISWFLLARLRNLERPTPPDTTAFGALYRHMRGHGGG